MMIKFICQICGGEGEVDLPDFAQEFAAKFDLMAANSLIHWHCIPRTNTKSNEPAKEQRAYKQPYSD